MKEKRFETIYKQGSLERLTIYREKQTGVNYLFIERGYSGGLTPLLDQEGKPVIDPVIPTSRVY